MKKRQDESWNVLLLGLLYVAAILFFHWRENKQEAVIIDIKAKSDDHEQRLKKLEDGAVQAEVKPTPPPQPKRVKVKPKAKVDNNANIATPNYPREPR